MKKLSLFKIGLVLSIIGIVGVGIIFSEGEKVFQSFQLDVAQTTSLGLKLQNSGIGFYKVSLPELGDVVFIQILDSDEHIIADKKIETKTAVNYFDFSNSGVYILRVTNLSDHSIQIGIEFGDTNSSQMKYFGFSLFVGVLLMIISGYRQLKNYKIAQPDEKIS